MPSAYLQWRFHSGERVVARGPLVFFLFVFCFVFNVIAVFCIVVTSTAQKASPGSLHTAKAQLRPYVEHPHYIFEETSEIYSTFWP